MGRKYERMVTAGLFQLNWGRLRQDKIEEGCCEVICGAPTTLQVMG